MRISKGKLRKDSEGSITEIHVTYDEAKAGSGSEAQRKVAGTCIGS
jgi:hypothetical protein